MFLDTNVLILMLNLGLEKRFSDVVDSYALSTDIYISSIVLGEILGYQGYDTNQADVIFKRIQKGFKIVKVDTKIILLASDISRYQRRNTGKKLKLTDAIIAATSMIYKKELMTFDKEDFKNIENLSLYKQGLS